MPIIRGALRVLTARPWLTAVVIVVVAGATTGYVLLAGGGSTGASAATTSRTVEVSTGTVSESVSTTGNLEPAVDENVSFASSATITSVRVTKGEKVTKGQVLGTIDGLSLKAALAEDRSSLASAKATLSDAQDDNESTSAQIAADKAQVRTARQAVASAKSDLSDAVLRAPVSGIVAAVNVSKGDQSSGSSSSGGSSSSTGTTGSTSTASTTSDSSSSSSGDFEIIGTTKWKVSVDVDDTEIGMIAKGQQAQLTTDNHTGTIFGTVTSVSVLSSSDTGSATYPVVVTVTGSPSGLHDGAEATVKIVYKQAADVLTVPTLAIHRDGNSSYVYLSSNGKKVRQAVKTGLTDGSETQITSGLKSGEEVYEDVITPRGTSGGTSSGSIPTGSTTGQFPGGGSGGFPGGGTVGFGGGAGGFGGSGS